MKKLIILSAIAVSGLVYNTADAQINFHIGFGFLPHRVYYAPAPPPVALEQPVTSEEQAAVYDESNDDYYYLPEVDAYYSVNEQCYYYNDGDAWVSAACLPGEYHDYDWRNATRYEVRAPRPYLRNEFYLSRYGHPFNNWAHNGYENHYRDNFGYRGQLNHNNFKGRDEHFDYRGNFGYCHPAEFNRGNDQYSDRGRGGFEHDGDHYGNRGVNEQFAQNSPHAGFSNRRKTSF